MSNGLNDLRIQKKREDVCLMCQRLVIEFEFRISEPSECGYSSDEL